MTIAAGFNFDHGILLCADTKHTGDMALYQSKVYWKELTNGAKCACVFAGNLKYAQMTIRKIQAAIEVLSQPSLNAMEEEIEKVLIKVHEDHLFKHPDWNTSSRPEVSLLIALWSPTDDDLRSYSTVETAITPFYGYECVGSGQYLGHYIINPRYHGRAGGLESVIFTALLALERIKRYDAFCGGYSDFVVLTDDGKIEEKSRFDIETCEQFSSVFFGAATAIYEEIALHSPDALTDAELKEIVERLFRIIGNARADLEYGRNRLEQLRVALTKQSSGQRLTGQQ